MALSFRAADNGFTHVCAHRGYCLHYPENTLLAFEMARQAGATTCEIDTVLSRDGEAVGLGMALAYGYSVEIGICPLADFERVVAHFRAIGLPENFRDAGLAGRGVHLLAAMQSDKKATSTGLTLILARGIGQAFLARSIDLRRLADFLVREV